MSNTLQLITKSDAVYTTHTLDLGDCDPSYRGATFDVWVTPTRAHLRTFADYTYWLQTEPSKRQAERDKIPDEAERKEFDRVMGEQLDREMYNRLDAWLDETWRNIPLDEVTAIREHLREAHPGAWDWLYNNTLRAIRDYRENLSKN